jgi:F-type H+-transporting ATPase subunit alpha
VTQSQLDRGYRMVEILKQGQYKPLNVIDQIMIIYAGNTGALDKVDRRKVKDWEEQFLRFMKEQKAEARDLLVKEKKMSDAVVKALDAAIKDFQPQFKA